jgi:hypothetical protein
MKSIMIRVLPLVSAVCIMAEQPAFALSKAEADAEHTRLSEEMVRLAKRGHWKGVDRSYRLMEPLKRKGTILSFDDHFLAAQAAQELGNVTWVYRRLLEAKAVEADAEVVNWLNNILALYGEVELIIPERFKGEVSLSVAMMPLQPDQRKTIGLAQQKVAEGKSYDGLLPAGKYTFGPNEFEVVPGGTTVVLNLDKRGGSQVSKRAAGEKEPFKFSYMGPRIDVGAGWTQASDAGVGSQPGGFGGLGSRAAVGWEMGVGGPLNLVVQVGYQGLTGSPADEAGALEEMAQFDLQKDQLHFGFGWLAVGLRTSSLWVGAGPMYGMGSGTVTGVGQACIDTPGNQACSDIESNNVDTLRYSQMGGSITAAGLAVGASYSVVEFGRLEGAVNINMGALSDASRWYPYGTMGLTVAKQGPEDDG